MVGGEVEQIGSVSYARTSRSIKHVRDPLDRCAGDLKVDLDYRLSVRLHTYRLAPTGAHEKRERVCARGTRHEYTGPRTGGDLRRK